MKRMKKELLNFDFEKNESNESNEGNEWKGLKEEAIHRHLEFGEVISVSDICKIEEL